MLPLLSISILELPKVPSWPTALLPQPFVELVTAMFVTGQSIVIVLKVASDWLNPSEEFATLYLIITCVVWVCAGTESEEVSVWPAATVAVLNVV